MSFFEVVIVGLGGFLGALLRYWASQHMNGRTQWPAGTFFVNSCGSFLIGLVFGMDLDRVWMLFFVSGTLGALTTFSTLIKECIELWQLEKRIRAIVYMSATVITSIAAVMIGYYI